MCSIFIRDYIMLLKELLESTDVKGFSSQLNSFVQATKKIAKMDVYGILHKEFENDVITDLLELTDEGKEHYGIKIENVFFALGEDTAAIVVEKSGELSSNDKLVAYDAKELEEVFEEYFNV